MAADSKFQASPDQSSYQHLPVTHKKGGKKRKKKKVRQELEVEGRGMILFIAKKFQYI